MQMTTEVQNTAAPDVRNRRGKRSALPFLLIGGALFMFVLSACQVAVAEDGTINIRPESTTTTGTNTDLNGQTGAGNTFAGLVTQIGEVDPTTASPIDPDQVYEWNGVIKWIDANTASGTASGGHFAVDRGCDIWAAIPQNDEVYAKLKELHGEKGTVWGSVSFDNVLGYRAIDANTAFAPGDIRPLIALPQVPCNDTPVPGEHIAINHSEVTLHGDLVWRSGGLWLVTERGNVRLELPRLASDLFPELDDALSSAGSDSSLSLSLGEYGVVGRWDLTNTGLVVQVREVNEWPHRTFVRDRCGGGFHHFVVGDEQLAAYGTLIINDGQWLLRTKSGVIFIHRNAVGGNGVFVDPTTGDVVETGALAPDVLRTHEVVVIGDWKTDGNELHMEGDKFVRVKTVCEPPKPPRQPILPGEIAALGTLVFENGRPFLNTPSGKIVLLRQNDIPGTEPEPVNPSFFEGIAPETRDAAGAAVGEDGTVFADPDIARHVRHILVVGKWLLYRDNLAIVVRYALPWPYPYVQTQPVDRLPVPPIFDFPLPQPQPAPGIPGVLGFPVEPEWPDDVDVIEPFFGGGFSGGFDGDVVIIEPDTRDANKPVRSVDGIAVNSFSPVSVK